MAQPKMMYDLIVSSGRLGALALSKEVVQHGKKVTSLWSVRNLHTTSRISYNQVGDDPIRNFEDFTYPNKKYTFEHHRMPRALLEKEYNHPVCIDTMGIKWPGYWIANKKDHRQRHNYRVKRFVYVKEMEPEIIVPDLKGFELGPYVSYAAEPVDNREFTAKALFDSVYALDIIEQFEENEEIITEVSQESIDCARRKALATGADLFESYTLDGVRAR